MKQLKITTKITSRDSFSIDKYLSEISKLPMMTEDEEVFEQPVEMYNLLENQLIKEEAEEFLNTLIKGLNILTGKLFIFNIIIS